MPTGLPTVQALQPGKKLYLDANIIIHLMQYAIAFRDNRLSEWSDNTKRLITSLKHLLEAGAYQMRRARGREILEDPSPPMLTLILSITQASHAVQMYEVMMRRISNRVPYRDLTKFSDIGKDICSDDLEFTEEALTYFLETWLTEKNLKNAIVLYPSKSDPGNTDTDLSVCFDIGRELSKYAYLDPEDALHLSTAIITKCTHFASTDKPLRDAIDSMLKNQTCRDQLHNIKADWELPRPLNPKTPGILSQLGWILPPVS